MSCETLKFFHNIKYKMLYKIIYLFVLLLIILLLFVFSLGTNTNEQEREGLTTTEEIKKKDESKESVNNTDVNSKSYDNYNHYSKSSIPTIFYGKNESKVILDAKTKTLYLIDSSGNTTRYNSNLIDLSDSNIDDLTKISFYNENGSVAKINSVNNVFIEITDKNGDLQIYQVDYVPEIHTPYTIDTDIYNNSPTTYYGSTGQHIPPMQIIKEFNDYDKSDLYILKSKIVPPLCPAKQDTQETKNATTLTKQDTQVTKNSTTHTTQDNLPLTKKEYKPKPADYPSKDDAPIIKYPNYANEQSQSCNLSQTPSQYKPHLTSYATSQIAGINFNKFKNVNSINSEFMPIPVLNSFHSFGK